MSVHVTLLKCIHRDDNKDGEKTRFSKTPTKTDVTQQLSISHEKDKTMEKSKEEMPGHMHEYNFPDLLFIFPP